MILVDKIFRCIYLLWLPVGHGNRENAENFSKQGDYQQTVSEKPHLHTKK